MKRSRGSKTLDTQEWKKIDEVSDGSKLVQTWSGFANDLPSPILLDILLRLPVKSILVCRRVCKTWRGIILDPEFAKLQYQRSEVHLMLRTRGSRLVSRTLFLVEVQLHNLNFRCCNCSVRESRSHKSRHRIPLRDSKMVVDDMLKVVPERRGLFAARAKFDKFGVVNSCNGLLCLSEPVRNEPVVVCNPITGEYIKIPEPPKIEKPTRPVTGFGFSLNTSQYKVVRMYSRWATDPHGEKRNYGGITELYTLGKGFWTDIGRAPCLQSEMKYPTHLNGGVHWFCLNYNGSYAVVSFDFETELFQKLPLPHPHKHRRFSYGGLNNMSMGVLRGYLCICDHSDFELIDIWVMKDYGVQGSWTNMISIKTAHCAERWLPGLYQVIKCYDNGAVLMFNSKNCLIYYDPAKMGFKYLKIHGTISNFEAFIHVPSLISLKDVVIGNDVEVLNVISRCGQLTLREEKFTFCFVEEDRERAIDSDAS